MAVLVKFAFDWPLLVRKGAVDGVVECLCSLVVGRSLSVNISTDAESIIHQSFLKMGDGPLKAFASSIL